MFIQIGQDWDQPNSVISKLSPLIFWCGPCKVSHLQALIQIYCSPIQCNHSRLVLQETERNFSEQFQLWDKKNVYRSGGPKLDYNFMSVHWLSNWHSIKIIWGKSGCYKTSLIQQNHNSGMTSWCPNHFPPWVSHPSIIFQSGHKVKHVTHRIEFKTLWRQNPQGSCWLFHMYSILGSFRLYWQQNYLSWLVS